MNIPRHVSLAAAVLSGFLLPAGPLTAQAVKPSFSAAAKPTDETVLLPEFSVQEDSQTGYAASSTLSATKIAMDLKDIPLSLDIVTEQQFRDFGKTDLYEIVGMTAGATAQRGDGDGVSYSIRGVVTFFSARNGVTGLRTFDSANVARVEIINGPASVLYGQIDPGGVVNTITKQPSLKFAADAKVDFGSWNYYRGQVGVTGAVNKAKTLSFRIDTSYLHRDGYRDYEWQQTRMIAPVLKWQPFAKTTLMAEAELGWHQLRGVSSYPRLAVNGVQDYAANYIKLPGTFNIVSPGMENRYKQRTSTLTFEQKLTDRIVFRNVAGFYNRWQNQWNLGGNTTTRKVNGIDKYFLGRVMAGTEGDDWSNFVVTNLAGRFDFGPAHYARVVLGNEFKHSRSTFRNSTARPPQFPAMSDWDLGDPSTWRRDDIPDRKLGTLSGNTAGFNDDRATYLIGAGSFFREKLMLLGGLRRATLGAENRNYFTNATPVRTHTGRTTPQIGGLWHAFGKTSVFFNKSQSYRQIASLRTSFGRVLMPYDPLVSDSIDIGLKFDAASRHRISGQIGYFDIVNKNARQTFTAVDALGTYSYEAQIGETRSQGAEVRLSGFVTDAWQLVLGYSYVDARTTKNPANRALEGQLLQRAPHHQANFTSSYRFAGGALKGLSLSAMGKYTGKAWAFGPPGTIIDPGTVYSVRAGYGFRFYDRPITAALLVDNVTDDNFNPSSFGPTLPRSFRLSLDYRY